MIPKADLGMLTYVFVVAEQGPIDEYLRKTGPWTEASHDQPAHVLGHRRLAPVLQAVLPAFALAGPGQRAGAAGPRAVLRAGPFARRSCCRPRPGGAAAGCAQHDPAGLLLVLLLRRRLGGQPVPGHGFRARVGHAHAVRRARQRRGDAGPVRAAVRRPTSSACAAAGRSSRLPDRCAGRDHRAARVRAGRGAGPDAGQHRSERTS